MCKKSGHFVANFPHKYDTSKPKEKSMCAMLTVESGKDEAWYDMKRNVEIDGRSKKTKCSRSTQLITSRSNPLTKAW